MPDADLNALIRLPSFAVEKAEAGPRRILTGMVSDALAVAKSLERALATARFRIGDHEFCDPDYRQILIWAASLGVTPEYFVGIVDVLPHESIDSQGRKHFDVSLEVGDGAIICLPWDLDFFPIHYFD